MIKCQPKAFVVYKGYPTRWNDVDWLSISFSSNTKVDFSNFTARLKIGDFIFTNDDLSEEWIINLTAEQTDTLPLGMNTASLIVYDTLGEGKPFSTNIPVLVKNWVDGYVEVERYNATIQATLENEVQLTINVEAGISVEVASNETETLPAGESAYVENIGTKNHLVLKFGIPQGEKGEKGEEGQRGPAGQDAKIIIRRL